MEENKMTRFYISWTHSGACYTRCFSSEKERADFWKRIEYYNPKTWEA